MKRFYFIFLILFFVSSVGQAAVNLSVKIDSAEISLEEQTEITLTISGTSGGSGPVIPKVPGLEIVQMGQSSFAQFGFGTGMMPQMSKQTQYTFVVVPSDLGEFTIPAFSIFSGGKEYKSQELKLTVVKERDSYATPPNTKQIPPPFGGKYPQQNPPMDPGYTQNQDSDLPFWIDTSVSEKNPYKGEQILFKFKFYTRENVETGNLTLPTFTDFWTEEIVPEHRGEETINGTRYVTYEKMYALFPLKEGELKIPETKMQIAYQTIDNSIRGFGFRTKMQNKTLKAEAISLTVKPLPEPMPADFTNLVGRFGVATSLTPQSIKAGESATLSIDISGSGNIRDGILPDLKWDGLKSYPDKPAVDIQKSGYGISGKKTFKVALVPSHSGNYKSPLMTLSYFDPKTAQYVPLEIQEMELIATASEDEKVNAVIPNQDGKNTQKNVIVKNIASIYTDSSLVLSYQPRRIPRFLFLAVVGGLPCFLLLMTLSVSLNKRESRFGKLGHKKRAYKNFVDAVKAASVTETSLLTALRVYLNEVFGVAGQSLTAMEIENLCIRNRVSIPVAKKLKIICESLEASQYGFSKNGGVSAMASELITLVDEIHKVVK